MTLRIKAHLTDRPVPLQLDLALPSEGTTVVTGRSGAGKTTLLRVIAGFETASSVKVSWREGQWTEATPTWQRRLGFVFQEASLFPHLSVLENLRFGARGKDTADLLLEWIERLKLAPLLNQRPQTLSGGERQRVALGRTLMSKPELLLLDEPFSAQDEKERRGLLEVLNALKSQGLPMIYVTHRLDDIAALGDQLIVMDQGQVIRQGTPSLVLMETHALGLLEDARGVLIDAEISAIDAAWHLAQARFSGGGLWVKESALGIGAKVRLHIAARDVSLTLHIPEASSIQNILAAEVLDITPFEDRSRVFVRLKVGEDLIAADITLRAAHLLGLKPGLAVYAQIKSVALHV